MYSCPLPYIVTYRPKWEGCVHSVLGLTVELLCGARVCNVHVCMPMMVCTNFCAHKCASLHCACGLYTCARYQLVLALI